MKKLRAACAVGTAAGTILVAGPALGADHREAPLIQEDLTADIADVYAFVSPQDPGNLVLAMTVNGFSVPEEAVTYNFSPNVQYSFHIDSTGDAVADERIDVAFTNVDGGQVYGFTVNGLKVSEAPVTAPSEEPESNPPLVNEGPGGILSFAGPRDDPFFFDVVGFFRFLAGTGGFTGTDGFAGYNVSAIVIEVPIDLIDGDGDAENLQVWGTTARRTATIRRSSDGQLALDLGLFEQVERMGNPAVNTALIPAAKKDFYNIGQPENDATDFAGDIVATLMALGTNEKNIEILASVAVPDTLKIDTSEPMAYPNGRAPADDVIDTLFFFIFNQTDTPDGVDANDKAFLDVFPYLADPHQAP